jgi:3-hydroxyacyl-[acyl-carrier-protein] dehydratase
MRFTQLDRIIALEKGKSISAVKCLSLSEEYLQDHFPRFPVMPGVLMLESLFQTSMWLVRATHDFKYSSVVLRETKSLKFQGFVQPGDSLLVKAEIKSIKDSITTLKVAGTVNGNRATSGRLVVDTFNLADRDGVDPALDRYMNFKFRTYFRQLCNQLDPENLSTMAAEPLVTA